MNIALVIAGGVGVRTNSYVPKQFIAIYDKPIIVYTMQNIMKAGCFDKIFVTASNGWHDFIDSYAKQYEITSFGGNITSGKTRFQSIFNGLEYLYNNGFSDSTVALVDANRPLIPSRVFNEAISVSEECDCVVAVEPCYDSMLVADSTTHIVSSTADRSVLFKGQAPEVCNVKVAYDALSEFDDFPANSSIAGVMLMLNKRVKYVSGSSLGFKITTADDITMFRAMVKDNK
jgi:2-C-methyl-D-erythritol 4-phosphate cytidylyltransferase